MVVEARHGNGGSSDAAAMKLLAEGEYGVLSAVTEEGLPYAWPLSYALLDGKIVIHTAAAKGRGNANIRKNAPVCLTVVGTTKVLPARFTTNYESAVAFGTARLVVDEGEKARAFSALVDKYCPGLQEEGRAFAGKAGGHADVFEVDIERLSAKTHQVD